MIQTNFLNKVLFIGDGDCDSVKLLREGKFKDVIGSELSKELLCSSTSLVTFEATLQSSISKKLENCNDNK